MAGTQIRGAVIGSPVKHSLSPLLHQKAYSYLGISANYDRIEVPQGELVNFFASHRDEFDYFSITMPLKEEALELGVNIDPLSTRIQSANTLYKREEKWNLTSTDGMGFVEALAVHGYTSFSSVLILGAGGTARAVVGALDPLASEITVLGRTSTRKDALASAVVNSDFSYQRWNDSFDVTQYDLVVNTTPAGAADLLADSLYGTFSSALFDIIYNPWPTPLASRWKDSGGEVISGVEMLLYQAIVQLELVLNVSLDHDCLAKHLRPFLLAAIA